MFLLKFRRSKGTIKSRCKYKCSIKGWKHSFQCKCISKSSDILDFLIKNGADITIKNNQGENGIFSVFDNIVGIESVEKSINYIGKEIFRRTCKEVSSSGQTLLSSCIQSARAKN